MEDRGASQTEIDAAVAAGTPAKRVSSRRGRPAKVATPVKPKAAAAAPSSAGKRGRGRPKKNAVAPPQEDEPMEEEGSVAEDGKH
jgi:hypothetical protein